MKKILALVACLCFCVAASVFAEEVSNQVQLDPNTLTGSTEVSLTIDGGEDSYTVVIPSSVTIDPQTQRGSGVLTLKSGWELFYIHNLKVRLTEAQNGIKTGIYVSDSYNDTKYYGNSVTTPQFQNFTLKSTNGSETTYAIQASNKKTSGVLTGRTDFSNVGYHAGASYQTFDLISVSKTDDNTSDSNCNLTFYVKDIPLDPGVYTDVLTFSVITE